MTQFDLYFLFKPEVKVEYLKQIISQQPQEVTKFTIFPPLYRSLIVKKNYKKGDPIWPLLPVQTGRWPQLDLYFLSKPEVKVYYLKKSYLNNRKR